MWPVLDGDVDNCTGWTTNSSATDGVQGMVDFGTAANRWAGSATGCNISRRLICMVDDPGSSTGAISSTQTGSTNQDSSTITFSSQSLGTASSDRVIVVALAYEDEDDLTVSTITLGGTEMNLAVSEIATNGDDNEVFLYYLSSSSGTTADVAVTFTGGTANGVGIDVYSLTGIASSFPQDTMTDSSISSGTTLSGNIDLKADGVAICVASHVDETDTWAWTNATEQSDYSTGATYGRNSSASITSSSDSTITVTATTSGSDTRRALACASWR